MPRTNPSRGRGRTLGPEPWGSRLTRARETTGGGLTQRDAADWLSYVTLRPLDPSTVSRLEAQRELPVGRKSGALRRNAYLLSVLYGVDPAELDLTDDDGPGETMVTRLRKEARNIAAVTIRQFAWPDRIGLASPPRCPRVGTLNRAA